MRKFKDFAGCCLAILTTALCAIAFLSSCDRFKTPSFSGDGPDSVYVAEYVEGVVNPTFTSLHEVTMFQNRLIEEYSIDETFRTLPENILNNVAAVCLKKSITVTKKDIVNEYKANRAVYDNLPKQNMTDEQPPVNKPDAATTAMEEQQKPVEKVSYRYEIDTINGKPRKILIKETRSYEQ